MISDVIKNTTANDDWLCTSSFTIKQYYFSSFMQINAWKTMTPCHLLLFLYIPISSQLIFDHNSLVLKTFSILLPKTILNISLFLLFGLPIISCISTRCFDTNKICTNCRDNFPINFIESNPFEVQNSNDPTHFALNGNLAIVLANARDCNDQRKHYDEEFEL